jgi:hypothetical protein
MGWTGRAPVPNGDQSRRGEHEEDTPCPANLRYALLVGRVAGLKPLAASSTTTVEFVWDGDLRARRGLGGCWQSRWVSPRRLCCLWLQGNARQHFRDLQGAMG